jgi:hypothetical protein
MNAEFLEQWILGKMIIRNHILGTINISNNEFREQLIFEKLITSTINIKQ